MGALPLIPLPRYTTRAQLAELAEAPDAFLHEQILKQNSKDPGAH
jgi:hypothetical protein